jgi:hypothetical protein
MDTQVQLSGESLRNCEYLLCVEVGSPDLGHIVSIVKVSMWGEIIQGAHSFNSLSRWGPQMSHYL